MPYAYGNSLTHSTANVSSTGVSTVLAANASRKYVALFNLSTTQTIWLGLSTQTAAVGLGVPLNPASATGGTVGFELSAQRGNLYTGAITAIASATTSVALAITQGL